MARAGESEAVRLGIRVRPGAARPAVGGAHNAALVVAVAERAVEGKATTAALRAVAKAVGVRPSAVHLVAGAASRDKVVEVAVADAAERARVSAAIATLLAAG